MRGQKVVLVLLVLEFHTHEYLSICMESDRMTPYYNTAAVDASAAQNSSLPDRRAPAAVLSLISLS